MTTNSWHAFRLYVAPIAPVVDDGPLPYVPLGVQPHMPGAGKRKPWLKQRAGETKEQFDHRTSHSCYNCGTYIANGAALNDHEDQCSDQGRRVQKTDGTVP